MADWPNALMPPAPVITPFALESLGIALGAQNNGLVTAASAAYPSANLALFLPFLLGSPTTVTKLCVVNGGTASGNVDVGIYDAVGTRIASAGSTAQAGTNALQAFDITDVVLGAGLYYLAVAKDDTTGTILRVNPVAEILRAFGCFQMASAFPLPATATFATIAQAFVPAIGCLTGGRTVL